MLSVFDTCKDLILKAFVLIAVIKTNCQRLVPINRGYDKAMVDHEGNCFARDYIDSFKTNSGCSVNEDCRRKLFRDKASPGHGLQNFVHETGRPDVLLILGKAMHGTCLQPCTAICIRVPHPSSVQPLRPKY